MTNWQDRFHELVADWLRAEHNLDVREVVYVVQNHFQGGGCETCAWDVYETDICWIDGDGDRCLKTFNVRLQELFN